jgi:predicted Na+-dependent transporter
MMFGYRFWAVVYGLYIWVQATLTIRWFGYAVIMPDDPAYMGIVFLVTILVVYGVGYFFFRPFRLAPGDRAAATILICAPGLLADVLVILFYNEFFPDAAPNTLPVFAAWVLWAYGVGAISGVWPSHLPGLPRSSVTSP